MDGTTNVRPFYYRKARLLQYAILVHQQQALPPKHHSNRTSKTVEAYWEAVCGAIYVRVWFGAFQEDMALVKA
jgi:hypothetical protein